MNSIKGLISHLQQEISWIEALNALLSDEQSILATSQFTELEALADKKQAFSIQLENSAKDRVELIGDAGLEQFLAHYSAAEAEKINSLNEKLANELMICRDLNMVNGQVIATNIHLRQEIVNVLSGSRKDGVSTYTASGDLYSAQDPSHHQEA